MKRFLASSAVLLAMSGCADSTAPLENASDSAAMARQAGRGSGAVKDQYVVVLKPGGEPRGRAAEIAAAHGGQLLHVYENALQGFSLRLPEAALQGLRRNPNVAFVEADFAVSAQAQTLPTGIDRADVEKSAFAKIDGVDDLLDLDIAILDSGIDVDHPDLRVVATFKNCIDTTNDDLYGHGTHVAGIAAAKDNGVGVVGVAPGARLWPVKVLDNYGNGTLSSVLCGVDFVAQNAAQIEVANMSFGGAMLSDALRSAVRASVEAGVVLTAAAGNSRVDVYGPDGVFNTPDDYVPAAYPEVAAISALADSDGQSGGVGNGFDVCGSLAQADDTMYCFGNYSRSVVAENPVSSPGAAIDLAAPGVAILSSYPGGSTNTLDGTSMAAPHAAGAAALYIRERGTRDVNGDGRVDARDVYAIRQALIDRAQPQSAWRADGTTADRDANLEGALTVATGGASEPIPDPTPEPTPEPTPVAPATTPDNGSVTVTEGTSGHAVVFTVRNQGSVSESFALSCATSGQVSSCVAPTSVSVAAGGTAEVRVSYSVGSAGSGGLSLTASGQGGTDLGSYEVTVEAAATPAPDAATVMHVETINFSSAFRAQSVETTAYVTIFDLNNAPVKEAQVTADWYVNGVLVETGTASITNGGGDARFRLRAGKQGDEIRVCVTGVSRSGMIYDPTKNHESCDLTAASRR